jgi:hypothetical protein
LIKDWSGILEGIFSGTTGTILIMLSVVENVFTTVTFGFIRYQIGTFVQVIIVSGDLKVSVTVVVVLDHLKILSAHFLFSDKAQVISRTITGIFCIWVDLAFVNLFFTGVLES